MFEVEVLRFTPCFVWPCAIAIISGWDAAISSEKSERKIPKGSGQYPEEPNI